MIPNITTTGNIIIIVFFPKFYETKNIIIKDQACNHPVLVGIVSFLNLRFFGGSVCTCVCVAVLGLH